MPAAIVTTYGSLIQCGQIKGRLVASWFDVLVKDTSVRQVQLDRLMRRLWPSYYAGGNEHSPAVVAKAWWSQKVLRRNSHVDWPVSPSSVIRVPERIVRGSRTPGLGVGCYLDGRNGIELGENVWIGPYVRIVSMNHSVLDYTEYVESGPIRIGANSWLGAGCTILPGVELGAHTVVGAGAVVTKSFPEANQLVAGNPARVVKALEPYRGSPLSR